MKSVARFRLAIMLVTLLDLTIPALAQQPPAPPPPQQQDFCKQKNNKGLCLLPVTLVNNYKGQPDLYLFIKGIIKENGQEVTYYVSNADGDVTIAPPLKAGQYTSLPIGGLRPDKNNQVMLPKLEGLRFFVSLDGPLKTCCNDGKDGGQVSEPNGWTVPSDLAPQGDKDNSVTIFDFLELTWPGDDQFGANTTQLEMFGLPMQLELTGTDSTGQSVTESAGFTEDFDTLMSDYMKLGAPWTNLVLEPIKGKVRRIISPYHGLKLQQNPFPAIDFGRYIQQVFTYYGVGINDSVTSSVCGDLWYGNSVGGPNVPFRFRVGPGGVGPGGEWLFEITLPDAEQTYRNQLDKNIIYADPKNPPKNALCAAPQMARDLAAQLIRTTLKSVASAGKGNSNLYQGQCPAAFVAQFYTLEPIQQYAKFWHDKGIKKKAYSFGFDDTCNQSSIVILGQPTALKITVGGLANAVMK
jgi:hypothetical protein